MNELQRIVSSLGLNEQNGLCFPSRKGQWKDAEFSNRINRLIGEKLFPDAIFSFDNKPLILFFVNPADKKDLHRTIWNYNESPIVFIIEKTTIEIFNGFKQSEDPDSKGLLDKIGDEACLGDFQYFKLVTGETW